MTRYWYGDSDDFTVALAPSGSVRVRSGVTRYYSAQTGGTQYGDLLIGGTLAATEVPSIGLPVRFQGPDGILSMWAGFTDATGTEGPRVLVNSTDTPTVVAAAAAGAIAVGTTSDTVIAGRLNDSTSLSAAAAKDAIAKQSASTYTPTAPNLGVRSDAFFLRSSADGDQYAQLAAFLADTNLAGKRRLVGYAKMGSPVAVPAGTWLDGSQATIEQTTTGKNSLNVTGDGVRIIGLKMIGPNGSTTARAAENAIVAVGTSAASPLKKLHLENVSVERFGMHGLYAQYVQGLRINGCHLSQMGYAGAMLLSVIGGGMEGGSIDTVLASATFSSNGYGIAMTRDSSTNSLTTDPRTQDFSVRGVLVKNIPWEGIDTHAGQRLSIAGNTVVNCKRGIAIVECPSSTGTPYIAPIDVAVTGNVIDGQGLLGEGIAFVGSQGTGVGTATQYATGSITGNVVRDHSDPGNSALGAIYARNTRGLAVSGNTLINPATSGVSMDFDNKGLAVNGNTIQEAWANSGPGFAAAILLRNGNNTGRIMGNTQITTGAKSGSAFVNSRGLEVSDATGVAVSTNANNAAWNDFSVATTPVSGI